MRRIVCFHFVRSVKILVFSSVEVVTALLLMRHLSGEGLQTRWITIHTGPQYWTPLSPFNDSSNRSVSIGNCRLYLFLLWAIFSFRIYLLTYLLLKMQNLALSPHNPLFIFYYFKVSLVFYLKCLLPSTFKSCAIFANKNVWRFSWQNTFRKEGARGDGT